MKNNNFNEILLLLLAEKMTHKKQRKPLKPKEIIKNKIKPKDYSYVNKKNITLGLFGGLTTGLIGKQIYKYGKQKPFEDHDIDNIQLQQNIIGQKMVGTQAMLNNPLNIRENLAQIKDSSFGVSRENIPQKWFRLLWPSSPKTQQIIIK